jgi:hypothetical protein
MTKRERGRRRRAKTKLQKANRRKNVIMDAERRLLGSTRTVAIDVETGGPGWYGGYTDVP